MKWVALAILAIPVAVFGGLLYLTLRSEPLYNDLLEPAQRKLDPGRRP